VVTAAALRALDAERDNIRSCLSWLSEHDAQAGVSLMMRLSTYWLHRSPFEGASHLRALLKAAPQARDLDSVITLSELLRDVSAGESGSLAEEALEMAVAVGNDRAELRALKILTIIPFYDLDKTTELTARSMAVARKLNDSAEIVSAKIGEAINAEWARDFAKARTLYHEAMGEARAIGDEVRESAAYGDLARLELIAGDYAAAADYARRASEMIRDLGDSIYLGWSLTMLAQAEARLGRIDQAEEALSEAVGLALEATTPWLVLDAAHAAMDVMQRRGLPLLVAKAHAAAANIVEEESQIAAYWELLTTMRADVLAAARAEADPVKFEVAYREALEVPPTAVLVEVREALAAPHSVLRPETVTPRHSRLTPREVEVATLLAQGKSDAEIADLLFISPKTASVHASRIREKLGAESRVEAALMARDLGLGGRSSEAAADALGN
jgi:DNA-binding NarL/FixJ family response regulator